MECIAVYFWIPQREGMGGSEGRGGQILFPAVSLAYFPFKF